MLNDRQHTPSKRILLQALTGILIFIVATTAASWWFYRSLYRQFDQALGEQLKGIARASAALVDGSWVVKFKPGDEETGLYKAMQKRLAQAREAHQVKYLYVFGPDHRSLLDATGEKGIGDTHYRLVQDRTELTLVWRGQPAYSVLFRGKEGAWYKTGYAPVRDRDNQIVAVLGVAASARFMGLLTRYRRLILVLNGALVLTGLGLAGYLWMVILAPIKGLVKAVDRMYAGDLSTRVALTARNEIGFLGASFNQMVQKLGENQEELRQLYQRAEHRAERIKNYNDYIVESMSNGVITLDLHGIITSVNLAAAKTLALTGAPAVGQDYRTVLGKWTALKDFLTTVLNRGRIVSNQELRQAGPPELYLQVSSSILQDPTGEEIGATILFSDITEMRKLEERMKLQERLAALGELSAGIAHELRNPLNGINLLLGILKRSGEDAAKRLETIGKIEAAVASLNRIITEFLMFARPAAPNPTEVNLARVLAESSEMAYRQGKSGLVTLKKEYDPAGETIIADAEQLKQVFLNLILNSLEATPSGGNVVLGLRRQGSKAVVTVTDTGEGIPRDRQLKIFDPFFTTKESGTGLGLSIARKIIEAHQGTISVRSPVGAAGGTEFTVELPIRGA